MGIISTMKIRKKNIKERERSYQSKRNVCCETCKYCYESESFNGYARYSCFLKQIGFDNNELFKYKCENYKPCRKYKKYLQG